MTGEVRPHPRRIRVAIVDRDDINRVGICTILAKSPFIELVGSATHQEALCGLVDVHGADVVLVNAVDDSQVDQFAGVAVVEHVRALHQHHRPTALVVTDHYFDSALRRRIREAGADRFYDRGSLRRASALQDATVRHQDPRDDHAIDLDIEACFRHGVTEFTRVNRAVAFALEHDLMDTLANRSAPRSRRWHRLRREFNREARLLPVTTDGCLPDRTQELPSLPQIARFLAWATRVKAGNNQ